MRGEILSADASGQILKAGGRGIGFCLVPAVRPGGAAAMMPGSFPVTVRVDGRGGAVLPVVSSAELSFAHDFTAWRVEGAVPGDTFLCLTLEAPGESYRQRSRTRATVALQAALTAVPTAAPALATDGWALRVGMLGHVFFFSGDTTKTATLWQRSRGGVWTQSGTVDLIDPAAETIAARAVRSGADRLYLQASGAGLTVAVDADFEVG